MFEEVAVPQECAKLKPCTWPPVSLLFQEEAEEEVPEHDPNQEEANSCKRLRAPPRHPGWPNPR